MKNFSISSSVALLSAGLVLISACQSSGSATDHVPASYLQGTTLDRNAVSARQTTEYIEVKLNPMDSQLRLTEIAKIKGFLADYSARGHGPLMMAVPQDAENPQLAVEAVVEARDLAWQAGIEYSEISGSAYDGTQRVDAPLIIAFKAYEAVSPDCPSLTEVDFNYNVSNNDLPTLGCAVRTNMAAMIADPADIFAQRVLEDGDNIRRANQFQLWREGQPTGATRDDAESIGISTAVN